MSFFRLTPEAADVFNILAEDEKRFLANMGFLSMDEDGTTDLHQFTCASCPLVTECPVAFNCYNTDGDCLVGEDTDERQQAIRRLQSNIGETRRRSVGQDKAPRGKSG